jgi:signal transduction histidine kinase
MGFSDFRLRIVLRVGMLLALCWLVVFSLVATTWVATPLACGALIVILTADLIRYQERTASELQSFLRFMAHHDYSTPAAEPFQGRAFGALKEAYQTLAGELRRLNLQKAASLQYLEAVVDHVDVALCCLDEQGAVMMCNQPARQLVGLPHLSSRQTFARLDERLPEILAQLPGGERTLLGIRRGDEVLQLLLHATELAVLGQRYKLVSLQNIRDELDRQELDSWQKLIRVLTHEIMSSVTPITSLSSLLRDTMVDDSRAPPVLRTLQPDQQSDMLRSITAIQARSSALLDFVRSYRSFATFPAPVPALHEARAMLERVRTLMFREIEAQQVAVELNCEAEPLQIHIDASQVEQALINLVRNALDALTGRPAGKIILRGARAACDEIVLQVIDNGCGIAPEHLESIFVPFFTTKRGGTGVGLTVARQLAQLNRAVLSVRSQAGAGSTFTLRFRSPPGNIAPDQT